MGPRPMILALLALAVLATPGAAQERRRPPVVQDSVAADTIPADTVPRVQRDPAADSIMELLRELQGYTVTEYQGESAVYRAEEGVLRLRGAAEVSREGNVLTADTIVYRDQQELVEAYGNPTVSGEAQELTGDVLYYDLANRRATALGAETTVSESATWLVKGDVTLEGTDRVYATHGTFTTCDLEIPHYHFEADKILVIKDKLLVARPARLYFGKVPVMVLPFIVQNLERGRRSGLLIPRFGINDIVRTSSGYTRQISDLGWYWAVNDYIGAQISGTWRSEAYVSLLGSVDYRWRRQFLDGRMTFQRYWRDGGSTEFSVNGVTNWEPDERTTLGLSANYATSSEFIREASYDPREVTRDLASSLRAGRRFDWGNVDFGAEHRKSVADGSSSGTLPRLGISMEPITLFRSPTPEQASWFSNATFSPGVLQVSRSYQSGKADLARQVQDRAETRLSLSPSLTVGNFSWSTSGNLNRTLLRELAGSDSIEGLPEVNTDAGSWSTNFSYRQDLIGTTNISPTLSFQQEIRRNEETGEQYLGGPMRMSFGAGLNTDLYGFFPGIGGYSAIRHRFSPRFNYSYAPAVQQSALQDSVFGPGGGRTRNVLTLTLNQTFEAKLREPRTEPRDTMAADTLAGDSVRTSQRESQPADPEKVTILSINTSSIGYDFEKAAETGYGWTMETLTNTFTSDYLSGLQIRVEHDLFDLTAADTTPGDPGDFSPRLSSFNTDFNLGPGSAILRWLGLGQDGENPAAQGVFPGPPPSDDPTPPGAAAMTGNPRTTGGGNWQLGLRYSYTRQDRPDSDQISDEIVQTLGARLSLPLTPNLSMNWTTDYSITDGKFGTHRLNFKRNLHRWQANFDFYQTPNGNTAFEFYVELIDNPDLKFDYREDNLGIDEEGRR